VTALWLGRQWPAYFVVEGKDGLKYDTATRPTRGSSRSVKRPRAAGPSTRFMTAPERDALRYTEMRRRDYRLATIQYTQTRAPLIARYSVELTYETIPVGEVDSSYFAGSQVKRITGAHSLTSNRPDDRREYKLTYEGSLSSTSRSRLARSRSAASRSRLFVAVDLQLSERHRRAQCGSEHGNSVPANVNPWPSM